MIGLDSTRFMLRVPSQNSLLDLYDGLENIFRKKYEFAKNLKVSCRLSL